MPPAGEPLPAVPASQMTPPCVFCEIVVGRVGASIVYAGDATVVFADRRQPTEAHLLVVPKQHRETIYDLHPTEASQLMQTVVLTARAVRAVVQPAGLSVWQSNGRAAGQEVPHVHVHVLARRPDDGLLRVYPARPPYPDRLALDQLAQRIKAVLTG